MGAEAEVRPDAGGWVRGGLDAGLCPREPAADLLHRHVANINTEIARLTELRDQQTTMPCAHS
jgi:hypothetical protein